MDFPSVHSRTRLMRHGCVLALPLGIVAVAATVSIYAAQGQAPTPLDPALPNDEFVCGTPDVRASRFVFKRAVTPSGEPLLFEQDPSILSPDARSVTLKNLIVLGDVPTLRFRLAVPADSGDVETWTRTGTTMMNGRLVSVFNQTWGSDALDRALRNPWGWDRPRLVWGEVLPGDTPPGEGRAIYFRVAPRTFESSRVTRIGDDVQFSSHVVNLQIAAFGTARTEDDEGFDFETVARKFYQHFEDSYDVLAVVPQDDHVTGYAAFHATVANDVRGIGEALFDRSTRYGSAGRLKAFELYTHASVSINRTSLHETAHQWGAYVDWARLTGVTRSGPQPEAHDPLWADRESFLSELLHPTRRVARIDGEWRVARTADVAKFHPLTRYAMGILPKENVPEIVLFDDQGQLNEDNVPDPGTPLTGATRSATIFNIIGMLGERAGTTPREWHRATIVVTRDRLLTQREMDYWNFVAARAEDPNRTGTVGWDGIPSFDLATDRAIDLRTAIRPKAAAAIQQSLSVDFPDMDAASWRGVRLDAPLKTRYTVGERVRISGQVAAQDRADFDQVLFRLIPDGSQPSAQDLRAFARISSAGTFVADFQLEAQHRGRHAMAVYLFWPDAGSQLPRSSVTTVVVE